MGILPCNQLDPVVEIWVEVGLLDDSCREKTFKSCEELQEAIEAFSDSGLDLVVFHLGVNAQSTCYDGVIDDRAFEVVFAAILVERDLLPSPVQHPHR